MSLDVMRCRYKNKSFLPSLQGTAYQDRTGKEKFRPSQDRTGKAKFNDQNRIVGIIPQVSIPHRSTRSNSPPREKLCLRLLLWADAGKNSFRIQLLESERRNPR